MSHHSQSDAVLLLTLTDKEVRGDELADALTADFTAALDRTGASKVVVDFAGVEFLSSACIRPLLTLHNRAKAGGGRVVLCRLQPAIAEVLRVMRFVDSGGSHPAPFETQPDVASAVASLFRGH